ncbi:hypothetical protein LI328DRAFT_135151 [Trichoderma asperelloides]|nr:hypothetical protein LI328DRAFT_135151 [Trichoderma asperelloides]
MLIFLALGRLLMMSAHAGAEICRPLPEISSETLSTTGSPVAAGSSCRIEWVYRSSRKSRFSRSCFRLLISASPQRPTSLGEKAVMRSDMPALPLWTPLLPGAHRLKTLKNNRSVSLKRELLRAFSSAVSKSPYTSRPYGSSSILKSTMQTYA